MSESLIISKEGAIDRLLRETLSSFDDNQYGSLWSSVKVVITSFLDGTELEREFAIRFVAELIEREGEV